MQCATRNRPTAAASAKNEPTRSRALGPCTAITALSADDPTLTGITVYGHDDGDRVTVRSFAPAAAVDEDPVCGSGNAAVGRHRALTEGWATGYTAHQGAALHRDGRVAVGYEGGHVTIGGNAVTTVRGTLHEF